MEGGTEEKVVEPNGLPSLELHLPKLFYETSHFVIGGSSLLRQSSSTFFWETDTMEATPLKQSNLGREKRRNTHSPTFPAPELAAFESFPQALDLAETASLVGTNLA